MMKEKKNYLINQSNQAQIEERNERFYNDKMHKISRMIEKSAERKEKLLRDRVKSYQMNDRRWFDKK